jgi:predicted Zn-dependent protease
MSAPMSRDDAQRIIERALKLSNADGCEVGINSNVTGNTRFGNNQITTAGEIQQDTFTVQSYFGPKHAVVQTDDLSDASIQRVVAQSERLAKLAPDDPENMPTLPPQTYVPVNAYYQSTEACSAADRARASMTALEPSRKAGNVVASGFIITGANASVFGN